MSGVWVETAGECRGMKVPFKMKPAHSKPVVRALADAVLLGLLTSIAVAWLAAYRGDMYQGRMQVAVHPMEDRLIRRVIAIPGMHEDFYLVNRHYGDRVPYRPSDEPESLLPPWARRVVTDELGRDRAQGFDHSWRMIHSSGWPLRCLWREMEEGSSRGGTFLRGAIRVGDGSDRKYSFMWDEPVALPLLPIWGGLIVDTAVFAVLWATCLMAQRAGCRLVRKRRGLCPTCAFDLKGGTGGCPECGWLRPAATS